MKSILGQLRKVANFFSYLAFAILLHLSPVALAETHVGDVTRFSPDVGQPLFPVGNINFFKQFAVSLDKSVEVGKTVSIGFAEFGGNVYAGAKAAFGVELGMCIGGNADFDLGFKPTVTVPDNFPYEYPLTLIVDEGLMPDSQFTTNFPPLGKAYVDLIFDIELQLRARACVFGCFEIPALVFSTCNLGNVAWYGVPILIPDEIVSLFAESIRCDPTIENEAYCAIEVLSWNRKDDSKFKIINFPALLEKGQAASTRLNNFKNEPRLEYTFAKESGSSAEFTVDTDTDKITTGGNTFSNGDELTFKGNDNLEINEGLPAGIAPRIKYYVVQSSGATFKVAKRKGGSPVDITTKGTGTHTLEANVTTKFDDKAANAAQSNASFSISAATVSTDSSVSAIDDLERSFTVFPASDHVLMEPRIDFESGLKGFDNNFKVRVESSGILPKGLQRGCVYYVVNADSGGLKFQLSTKVGGPAVDIQDFGALPDIQDLEPLPIGVHRIRRSAEFNSVDGLTSSGAEDVAAFSFDVAGAVSAMMPPPFMLQGGQSVGPIGINYELASLELGPAIQLKTDFHMTWDLVVDDMVFRKAGTIEPSKVQFPALVNDGQAETYFASLKEAFPGRVFHLTNRGEFKLPEISLLKDEVEVVVTYHLEPKLKTKVSAPFLGRIKYTALEAGASIDKVGSLSLGPVIEGEKTFDFGEFTVYDGNPFAIDSGRTRTDFETPQDRDRYDLVLVDETQGGTTPDTGCAQVFVIKKGDGLYLKIFDVEGDMMRKRSGVASEIIGTAKTNELAILFDDFSDSLNPDKTANLLKLATNEVAGLQPGIMRFNLKAAGPADYQWTPILDSGILADSQEDFKYFNIFNPNPSDSVTDLPYEFPYPEAGPQGQWSYGMIKPASETDANSMFLNGYDKDRFNKFDPSWWNVNDYSVPRFAPPGSGWPYIDFDGGHPTSLEWVTRRWTSPGGRVRVDWDVTRADFSCGEGVSALVFVGGVKIAEKRIGEGDSSNYDWSRKFAPNAFQDFASQDLRATAGSLPDGSSFELVLTQGQVVDLVLTPISLDGDHHAGCDTSYFSMNITGLDDGVPGGGYTWATPDDVPTNWAEFLQTPPAYHKPNAYPGSLYTEEVAATNWATIEMAPYPNLTTSEAIGTLQVKEAARLDFAQGTGGALKLDVQDGAVANAGVINIRGTAGSGEPVEMRFGGPNIDTKDTMLTGNGEVRLSGIDAAITGWKEGAGPSKLSFTNFNTITGSGKAMNLLETHSESKVSNFGTIDPRGAGNVIKTGANEYINGGHLTASAGGTLKVIAERFHQSPSGLNEINDGVYATGSNSKVDLSVDEAIHTGELTVEDGGSIEIRPGLSGVSIWSAGQPLAGSDTGRFTSNINGALTVNGATMVGGEFYSNEGFIVLEDAHLMGSRLEIGKVLLGTGSGYLFLNGDSTRFTKAQILNHALVIIDGSVDVIDSALFANHGEIRVGPGSSLRIHEVADGSTAEEASAEAKHFPGFANADGGTLVGGTWDIKGDLIIDGAAFTKIGGDTSVETPSIGSANGVVISETASVDNLLALGSPARVSLSGEQARFPALDALNVNCGNLSLSDGADLPYGDSSQRTSGDFENFGSISVSGTSALKVGGDFYQRGADASVSVFGGGEVSSSTGHYEILGGSVVTDKDSSFMNRDGEGFLPNTTIRIQSTFVREGTFYEQATGDSVVITPVSVSFGEAPITRIDADVDLTLHGSRVNFPQGITSNAGRFTISGDHGLDNGGRFQVLEGSFTNTGEVNILGRTSKLSIADDYLQSGEGSRTYIGNGATLQVDSLNVSGGEIVVDIGARPHHPSRYGHIRGRDLDFGDRLVFNFNEDFLKVRPDIGDSWELAPPTSRVWLSGVDTITYLLDGDPMPTDWLPAGSHLELGQFPRLQGDSNRRDLGLRLQVVNDAEVIKYDAWSKEFRGAVPLDYPDYLPDYYFGASNGEDQGQFQQSLVMLDGEEFYQLTYRRRSNIDATFFTNWSFDLKNWYPAAMGVQEIVPLGDGFESVTLRSTFPLPDHRLFLQVNGLLNLENTAFGLVPEKPISYSSGSPLRGLKWALQENIFQVSDVEDNPYELIPGRVLYMSTSGDYNNWKNSVIGGTAANGIDRDFVYEDNSALGGAVIHAGLLDDQQSGIIRVTLVDRQPTFLGSTQFYGDTESGTKITSSRDTSLEPEFNEEWSYRVELIENYDE